jgi:Lrp/AsnC family transcriptional regulator for asnA, asnC and gidA
MDHEKPRDLFDLDETDLQTIRLLQEDGRLSNSEIARRIGVSEPTVRKRIERLIQDEIIKVVAVLNPRRAGYAAGALVGIRTYPGRTQEVGEQLVLLNEVIYVGYITGRFDLLVEVLLHDEDEMFVFLTRRLRDFSGISAVETFHVLRNEKINYDWKLPVEMFQRSQTTPESPNRRRGMPQNNRRATRTARTAQAHPYPTKSEVRDETTNAPVTDG